MRSHTLYLTFNTEKKREHINITRDVKKPWPKAPAGKLDFGPWQQFFYAEFDGRRKKRVVIKLIGE